MAEHDSKYNPKVEGEVKGLVIGEKNTINNYYYWEETRVTPVDHDESVANEALFCPYRGLFHFGPDDAKYFFGRKAFVEELFQATQTRNFIPVLGASGSGKSSVVLAGLVPRLQKEGHWLFTHFRPGSEPFQALARALVPLYEPYKNVTEQIHQARQLAEYFVDGSVHLKDVFSQIEQNYPNYRVLLIADQFEEIYTLCGEQETRLSFLDTLLTSFQSFPSQSQSSRVLVLTMRADFLGNALSYRPFADILQNPDIKLRPMNHEEISQVIVKPASNLGVMFEVGLVERILDDVENEPGNLPLLEFALTELWKRRKGKQLTHAAYEEIGKVQGSLASYANEKYDSFTDIEQEQIRRIFIQLVCPGENTEDTRRLATKVELGETSWELVTKLADARLVVTSKNTANQKTVELVHEALINNWDKLQQWINNDRRFRAWQERLRLDMYQWKQTPQDKGALLRGGKLQEAERNLEERLRDLAPNEQEFIQKSIEERKKQEEDDMVNALFFITPLLIGLGIFFKDSVGLIILLIRFILRK